MGAQFTLGRIAEALGATLQGDSARVIRGVAPLDGARVHPVAFPDARIWGSVALVPELSREVRAPEMRVREPEVGRHG